MPAAYLLAQVQLVDENAFQEYKAAAPASVTRYGGEFLVRGGKWQRLEGKDPLPRLVVLKFPSFEQALKWYHSEEYQNLKAIREKAGFGNLVLVEGVE